MVWEHEKAMQEDKALGSHIIERWELLTELQQAIIIGTHGLTTY
jgi:hypothetical protein